MTLRRLGDGTTWLSARLPDAAATRLATYLEAYSIPRRLETLDPKRLPVHGGDATTIVVTIPFESLKSELGAAEILGVGTVPSDPNGPSPLLDLVAGGRSHRSRQRRPALRTPTMTVRTTRLHRRATGQR